MSEEKQRTLRQNRALHKYCELMSSDLQAAGIDQRAFYELCKDGFEVPWSMEAFKGLFRQVAHTLYPEIESTSQLTTKQLQTVYEVVDSRVSELTGVRNEWPSIEPPLLGEAA